MDRRFKCIGCEIRRGSFVSQPDLMEKMMALIEAHNEAASEEPILEKTERCRKRLEEISPGFTSRKQRKVP